MRRAGKPCRHGKKYPCKPHYSTARHHHSVQDAGVGLSYPGNADDNGSGTFSLCVRYRWRHYVRKGNESIFKEEDQPHDRRGGHFRFSDVRASRA